MKYKLTLAIIASFLALSGSARAQVTTPNYWVINTSSSTIAPRISNLQVPCANISGGCVSAGAATTTINGVTGNITLSVVSTSSPSSISTSSQNIFLNLLKNTSSSDITITSTGTIIFANHNISQFTNDSGYLTSITLPQNLYTTSTPTFNGITINNTSSLAALKSIVNGELDFASATIIFANATSSGDYSDYLTSLCSQSGTNGYKSAVIQLPAGFFNLTKTVVDTNHCLYRGVANRGTTWNWAGAQGGIIAQVNQSSTFSGAQPSGGFDSIRFEDQGGSESITNPVYGVVLGGDNGGAYDPIISNSSFGGLGVSILEATGTVGAQVYLNTFTFNGRNLEVRTASGGQSGGSGEGVLVAFNWIADGRGGTSTLGGVQSGANDCILFGSGSVENAFLTDNVGDNCGVHVMGFNNVFINGFEIENSQSVGDGAYIPFVIDANTTSHVTIENVQVMNDASSTANTYPALFYVGSNVQASNITLNTNASTGQIPLPTLFMNDGNGGSENFQLCNVVNNSAFSQFVTSTVSAFPTSTFSGCLYQVANLPIAGEYVSPTTGSLTAVNWASATNATTTSMSVTNNAQGITIGGGTNTNSNIGFEQVSGGSPRTSVGFSTTAIGTDTGYAFVKGGLTKGVCLETNDSATCSEYINASGTTLRVPISAGPLTNTSGTIAYDTNHNLLVAGDGNSTGTIPKTLYFKANGAASDTINSAGANATDTAFTTTYTFPAGYFTQGKTARVSVGFQESDPGTFTNETLKMQALSGGATTTIFTTVNSAGFCAASQTCSYGGVIFLSALGATGSSVPLLTQCVSCNGGSAASLEFSRNVTAQPVSINTASSVTLRFTTNYINNTNPATNSLMLFGVEDVN